MDKSDDMFAKGKNFVFINDHIIYLHGIVQ